VEHVYAPNSIRTDAWKPGTGPKIFGLSDLGRVITEGQMQMEILRSKLNQLNLSNAGAAALCGGSATALSQELAGVRPMPNAKYVRLNNDLTKLLEISAAVAPLTLDLKNIVRVREWLDLWPDNLKIVVQDLRNG
jgi:hypothetical protein